MLVSKDILPIAKLAKKYSDRFGVTIYPDGRVVGTDSFSLIEVNRKNKFDSEDFPIGDNKFFEMEKPLNLPSEHVLNKQKFEKKQSLPILENGALLKGENGTVKIRTTDLDTVTEISYKPMDVEFPKYEELFPKNPTISTTYNIDVISGVLNRLKELGVSEITFLTSAEKDKPLILITDEIRALVMPFKDREDKLYEYKHSVSKKEKISK